MQKIKVISDLEGKMTNFLLERKLLPVIKVRKLSLQTPCKVFSIGRKAQLKMKYNHSIQFNVGSVSIIVFYILHGKEEYYIFLHLY